MQPRRISAAEAQSRREKGLCYYCDAKFIPGHKCKDPQLFLLDDELEDEQPVQTTVVMTNESNKLESSDDTTREQSLVSFNALAGCLTPNTLRVMGEVHGRQTLAGMTPFQALYGREPPTIVHYLEESSTNAQVNRDLQERDALLRVLKHNLSQAQGHMKTQADKHRRELEL
ncbi:hypothetical protein F3Y22_tig00112349pilonHSYRG00099 [Hibiscus syriacus]|uniref:Uncharacterized protein n=1 Tax=Hibiscus syriacus TaxID=106335 RepID=A0A6A2X0B7_HIBSY|nr:hypothetical protein F3Y22_tig00112349pilonHSYRG00099 [Hibiscus syriacus]